jgi:hypothetical protein
MKGQHSPTLRELQQWMRWIITDPRGVVPALSKAPDKNIAFRHRYLAPEKNCTDFILDQLPLSREERLSIYAEAYFARILESLSADYQTVLRLTGEDAFTKLIADYLKAYPSTETNIGEIGNHLSIFLETHQFTKNIPILPELAKLEWLTIESFYANDLPVLEICRLNEITPESWPGVRFTLDPSVFLMESKFNSSDVWNSNSEIEVDEALTQVLIYRFGGTVRVEAIDALQFQTLGWMKENNSLAQICEKIIQETSEMPPLMIWFQNWIASGIIREIN